MGMFGFDQEKLLAGLEAIFVPHAAAMQTLAEAMILDAKAADRLAGAQEEANRLATTRPYQKKGW